MLQPKFTLSWEGYQRNICSGLGSFQQNEDFVDMTLAADGHFVKVHQIIISLVSPYLKELIKSAQCPHPVIFLNKISYQTLCSVLEYIYTGEVTVAKENMDELAEAGRELRIKGLDNMIPKWKGIYGSFSLRNIAEKHLAIDQKVFCGFVDLEKAFDRVVRKELWNILPRTYINNNDDDDDANMDDTHNDPIQEETNLSLGDIGRTRIRFGKSVTKEVKGKLASRGLSTNTAIQYTVSNQGKLQIIVNRFIYYVRYTGKKTGDPRETRRTWRCIDYNALKCSASVITKGNIVVGRTTAHTHPFHDKKIAKKVMKGAVFSAISEAEQKGDILKISRSEGGI